jgi:pimeloyl-ACP methyl ester carboxylesterase
MFASRYLGIPLHPLAERAGVRLLVVDRPGMGESTDVPTAQRIAAWTDLVPRLLAHLGIPRVSLVAHSAGTMYLLNTWAKCPELVNPALTFLGIFIHPSITPSPDSEEKKNLNLIHFPYSPLGGS